MITIYAINFPKLLTKEEKYYIMIIKVISACFRAFVKYDVEEI